MFVIVLSVVLLVTIYLYCTRNQNYWSKRNVKHLPPIPLFGNHLANQLGQKSTTEIARELYNLFPNEKVVGYYKGPRPELIIRDLDLARRILSVDFAHFQYRGLGRDVKKEPLLLNLFHVDGDTWRLLRQRLTPAFTTAKLKGMFPLVVRCAERLQALLGEGGERDAREFMARFTTEFIGACGFGIEMDTINDGRSQFRELGKLIFSRSYVIRFKLMLWELFPELRSHIAVFSHKVDEAIMLIVKMIRDQRGGKPSNRNDFIDLLLELEAKGKIVGESIEKQNPDGSPAQAELLMDLKVQAAQVFIFFAAGFETSSSATSYTLHELSFNPDVQKRVQAEIDEVMLRYDNKLCYDAVAEMKLLEMTFFEGMRMFPSLGNMNRVCTKRYTIPELDIVIDPGVGIIVPVQAIHMDEQYFDNPEEFRPERFTPEEVKARHKFAYLPFGAGPRECIGERLGKMQSLAGLAAILHKFTVQPAPGATRKIKVSPLQNVVQGINGELNVVLTPRKQTG